MILTILLIVLLVVWGIGMCTLGFLVALSIWKETWGLLALFGCLFNAWVISMGPILVIIYLILSFTAEKGGWMYAC